MKHKLTQMIKTATFQQKKLMKATVTIFSLLLASLYCSGQDTIRTLEGNLIVAHDYIVDESYGEIEYKNEKKKIRSIDTEDVFSITSDKGEETVLYKYDPAMGNGLEVDQMRDYVYGQIAAKQHHKEPLSFMLGFAAGASAPFIMEAAGGNNMYAPLVPLAYISIAGLTKPNGKKLVAKHYSTEKPELFIAGYSSKAKGMRISNCIFGSLAGLIVGIAAQSINSIE